MTTLLKDLAVAPLAGYVGTWVMEPFATKLYELEPEEVKVKRTPPGRERLPRSPRRKHCA